MRLFFLLAVAISAEPQILQLADFHYDAEYDRFGDTANLCHRANDSGNKTELGEFGDYKCDSPESLVENAVKAAAKVIPEPDLIIWTGDNIPHIEEYGTDYVKRALEKTTQIIRAAFPRAAVLPTVGNHDVAPPNQFSEQDEIYKLTWDLWKDTWMREEEKTTYLKGGYYSRTIGKAVYLVLNTNLYYSFNKANFTDESDPAGQYAYSRTILDQAKNDGNIVNIVAHIPPGVYERKEKTLWFTEEHNKLFLKLVNDYSDVIKLMIFGHHHSDTFHVVRDSANHPIQVCYISPAVTPWYSSWGNGANNPSFRIFDVNSTTWELNDVLTYYVNLNDLNNNSSTEWSLEYSFKDAYDLSDFSPSSIDNLVEGLKKNSSLWNKYIYFNTVQQALETPNATVKLAQICSVAHSDYDSYVKCLNNSPRFFSTIYILAALLLLIFTAK